MVAVEKIIVQIYGKYNTQTKLQLEHLNLLKPSDDCSDCRDAPVTNPAKSNVTLLPELNLINLNSIA